MERHFAVHERPLTFEELVEMSRRNPREVVQMVRGEMMFQQQGEFEFSESSNDTSSITGNAMGIEDQLKKVKIPGPSALSLSAL